MYVFIYPSVFYLSCVIYLSLYMYIIYVYIKHLHKYLNIHEIYVCEGVHLNEVKWCIRDWIN